MKTMPVSVCDAATVNAIRESIANSSSNCCDDSQNLQNNLVATTKRVLLSKIEYEEVNKFNPLSVFDTTVKSKCISLKPLSSGKPNQSSNGDKDSHQNSSSALNSTTAQHQEKKDANQLPQPKRILFPKENVQIGWKSSGRKWQVGAGMTNLGNTCYLNSILQALFHVPSLANWLLSDTAHRERCENENTIPGGCINCAMAKTLIASQTSQGSFKPILIYNKLKYFGKLLVLGRQEDAHEFFKHLVEAMEKQYLERFRHFKELDQYSMETTPINQILGGYLKSTVRCLTCGYCSVTFQHFQDILVDIRKANTIEEALDGYFGRERLEDMGYKCESCMKKNLNGIGSQVSATKQFSIERAPVSLCIQLKRFSMLGVKISKHVAIRTQLDLTPYTSRKNNEPLKYRLVAMVNHLGVSPNCGHYTAIGCTDAGGYYQFDDSSVRSISIQNVLSTNAYIIFYELEDSQQNLRQSNTLASSTNNEQIKVNGQLQFHDNSTHRQSSSGNGNYLNGTATTSNSTKGISKLESFNTSTIIGPQLPDKSVLKNNQNTNENGHKNNENLKDSQNCSSTTTNTFGKLVNSSNTGKLKLNNENICSTNLSKQKENQLQSNKLPLYFKNNNVNGNNSNGFNNGGGKSHETNGSKYQTNISTKNQVNGHDLGTNVASNPGKPSLPSMPRLESPATKDKSLSIQNGQTAAEISSNRNKKPIMNGLSRPDKIATIKSLVPYDSDDESNDSAACNNSKNDTKFENNGTKSKLKSMNCFNRNGVDTSDDDSLNSSKSRRSTKHEVKLSPLVVNQTGPWEVTTANGGLTNGSPEKKNPFATPCTSTTAAESSFHSNHHQKSSDKKINGQKWSDNNNKNDEYGETVNQLLKLSHKGYGAHVLSWNGQKTDMEKEITEEVRLERKRELRDEEDNEMDRGRQKKIKTHGPTGRDNPLYNPFQEYQNQYTNRRWVHNGHSNNRPYSHSYAYRHNSMHRYKNNFRKNRFHQKPHHQRNGDNGFHHRRNS